MHLTSLIFIFILCHVTVGGSKGVVLRKCTDFQDRRSKLELRNGDIHFTIPASLSSRRELDYEPLHFTLNNETTTIECDADKILKIDVAYNETGEEVHSHRFTPNGDFYDGTYYSSSLGGYCFQSVSDTGIELVSCMHANELETSSCPSQNILKFVTNIAFTTTFFLATVCVYLSLLDKLNLNGIIILTQSITILLADVTAIPTYLLSPPPCGTAGWTCYFAAISAHFFYIASFMWLTIMNFDLWTTFSSMRVVKNNSKELQKFANYSVLAWGVPFFFVLSCILIDVFAKHSGSFPVPGYAEISCFMDYKTMDYYVFLPEAIFMVVNFAFIFLTLRILFAARSKSPNCSYSSKNKYSFKLFGKLFILMGGAVIIDFISWIHSDYYAPLWVEILEYARSLDALIFFIVVCLNEKILGQLQEKFPSLRGWWGLPKIFTCRDGLNSEQSQSGQEYQDSYETVA